MPQAENQIVVIQYLRGIAAILVVLYHSTMMTAVAPYFPHHIGANGVDLFFIISGFVMWTTTVDKKTSPFKFWTARISRIVPLYWIATLAFIVSAYAYPSALQNARAFEFAHIVKSLFFIPATNVALNAVVPAYTIGWTLNYEMLFYFIFGLSLFIHNKFVRVITVTTALILLCTVGAKYASHPVMSFYSNSIILEFLAGLLIAMISNNLMALDKRYGALLLGFGLASIVASSIGVAPFWLNFMGCALLVAGALAFERIAKTKLHKTCLLIGDASYSIYLFHPFFQRAIFILIGGAISSLADAIVYALLAFLMGTIGGIVTYKIIELPIKQMMKVRIDRLRDSFRQVEGV
jgi:exopolysaccharide production protein ExoZ